MTTAQAREKAIRFGSNGSLVGIVTDPPAGAAPTGVIMLNSGLLHRVGAGRFHVDLARRLGGAGLTSLRFDFSGIGDSEPRPDALAFEQAAVLEVREAMDYLASTRRTEQFVLVGLCSGADMGFYTAQRDPRVVGLVQLDPFVYRTWRYYVKRFAPKLLSPRPWINLLTGRTYVGPAVRRWLGRGDALRVHGESAVISPYARDFPPRDTVAEGLRTLTDRGVRIFNVFTGGQQEHMNHRRQYRDAFRDIPFGTLLDVEYHPSADHVFTDVAVRKAMIAAVAAWILRHWSPSAAPLHGPVAA